MESSLLDVYHFPWRQLSSSVLAILGVGFQVVGHESRRLPFYELDAPWLKCRFILFALNWHPTASMQRWFSHILQPFDKRLHWHTFLCASSTKGWIRGMDFDTRRYSLRIFLFSRHPLLYSKGQRCIRFKKKMRVLAVVDLLRMLTVIQGLGYHAAGSTAHTRHLPSASLDLGEKPVALLPQQQFFY